MRIGYTKLGRSWNLDPNNGSTVGGDADVARALHLLSRLRPQDEFVLVSANSCENPQELGYPDNVKNWWATDVQQARRDALRRLVTKKDNGQMSDESVPRIIDWYDQNVVPTYDTLDGLIVWAGQHGTSNMPLPSIKDRSVVTNPQDAFTLYCSHILRGLNRWRDKDPASREEMWLCPDPRNYLKARDVKWPLQGSVIAQFEQVRASKHERFGDETPPPHGVKWGDIGGVWVAKTKYTYDALEMTALPSPQRVTPTQVPWDARYSFGMIVNENRAYVSNSRVDALSQYVLQYWPDCEIFGKWTDKSLAAMNRPDIRPCPYQYLGQTLQRWRCTLTTPASGSGWATAKPWECFAYGVVCFFHPAYDTQDHVLEDAPAELRQWLRVSSPEQLKKRVDALDRDRAAWEWIIATQRAHYEAKYDEHVGGVREINRRLG